MILERLKKLVAEQFGVNEDDVTAETSFIDDLDADSIDIVEFIMSVEEEFGLPETDESALEGVRTIGDVAAYVQDKQ
ncbi:MAG: acyl carrier protein [Clostridia bacterium]|nr:acyl carrier protein [Clostridia bacterium]MBR3866049.1 acyl carrier protein [Clostridia bacterium]